MKFLSQALSAIALTLVALLLVPLAVGVDVEVQGRLRAALLLPATVLVAALALGKLLTLRVRYFPLELTSRVSGHTGPCAPVWVNRNQVDFMLTGSATGFFRGARRLGSLPLVWLSGPEFHGCLRNDQVLSTAEAFGRRRGDAV